MHHQGGTCSLGERWWFPGSSLLTLDLFIVFQMCSRTSPSVTGKWPCNLCQPFMWTWNPSARRCPCFCNGLSITSGLWGELESIPLPSGAFFVSSTHCKCLIFSFPSPTQRTPVLLVEISFLSPTLPTSFLSLSFRQRAYSISSVSDLILPLTAFYKNLFYPNFILVAIAHIFTARIFWNPGSKKNLTSESSFIL